MRLPAPLTPCCSTARLLSRTMSSKIEKLTSRKHPITLLSVAIATANQLYRNLECNCASTAQTRHCFFHLCRQVQESENGGHWLKLRFWVSWAFGLSFDHRPCVQSRPHPRVTAKCFASARTLTISVFSATPLPYPLYMLKWSVLCDCRDKR